LASLLVPGDVIVDPPLEAPPPAPRPEPGDALGLELDRISPRAWALQASKSDGICAATRAGAHTASAAMATSVVVRVKLAMKLSS
jgi:hypothetical protein